MRAAVVERYGGPEVVRVVEVPTPEPRSGEVLVRVRAVAVSSGDARIRAARFPPGFAVPARLAFGVRRPRRTVLGAALSGVVERAGAGAERFAVGDEVAGMAGMRMGGHAELVRVQADRLVRTPAGVSHDEAAGVLFGGSAALCYLRDKGQLQAGESVLVIGASGAIGTNAVQLARHLGAATVVAVTSGANADLAVRLGAGRVIDYTEQPLVDLDERFDVVLDAVGALTARVGRRLLTPGGRLLLAVAGLGDTVRARGAVKAGPASERAEDVEHLLGLVADGELQVVIDSVHDLDHIADAHRRVDTGHKVGNVIVRP